MAKKGKKAKSEPEELAEILDTVAEKLPAILKGLRDSVYSEEAAEQFAQAVGVFYKRLIEQGIPPEHAGEMTKDYMISMREITKRLELAGSQP